MNNLTQIHVTQNHCSYKSPVTTQSPVEHNQPVATSPCVSQIIMWPESVWWLCRRCRCVCVVVLCLCPFCACSIAILTLNLRGKQDNDIISLVAVGEQIKGLVLDVHHSDRVQQLLSVIKELRVLGQVCVFVDDDGGTGLDGRLGCHQRRHGQRNGPHELHVVCVGG